MARLLFNLAVSATTLAIAGLSALPASAASLTWTLNNVQFWDGSTATGSFDYDGQNFSNINIQTPVGYVPGGTYGDERLLSSNAGFLSLSSDTLKPYEYGNGDCCQFEITFATSLSSFSNLFADDVAGGIASVDFWANEYGDLAAYTHLPRNSWRIVPIDRSGPGTATAVLPTRPTPVPTPALLPALVGLGIAAWRKRKA